MWFLTFPLNMFYESLIHIINERGGNITAKYFQQFTYTFITCVCLLYISLHVFTERQKFVE